MIVNFECKDTSCDLRMEAITYTCQNCIKRLSIKLTPKQIKKIVKIISN